MIKSNFPNLDKIKSKSKFRFLYLPGLWSKKVLQKYIVNFETPYMAEKMGDLRSMILSDGFYAISNEYLKKNGKLFDCGTSGVIIKGKWEKWLPERIEENNISLDYSIRGFRNEKKIKTAKNEIIRGLIKNPINTLRSFYSILFLYVSNLIAKSSE